ncbi:helix-turn-helix domain-containing protein [Desulfovibrio piger]|uniref:helix-turn-helix domain-containing protein n=1 Tax=Desulfovibrio piger TaxID=901 RepID=UPI0026EE3982|nr:helix-turn-helix transcriptional regulator [Desulfovibrio piger]
MKSLNELFEEIAASISTEELVYSDLCFLITKEITRQMTLKGMTQTQLAQKIGKTPAFVSRALSGDQNLTLKTIASFIAALDSKMEVKILSQGSKGLWLQTSWDAQESHSPKSISAKKQKYDQEDYNEPVAA